MEQVQERMAASAASLVGKNAGHDLVAFHPSAKWHLKQQRGIGLQTCRRCLRTSSGGWNIKCKGSDGFKDVSALKKKWKIIRTCNQNAKMLLAIWHDPNKGRRIGEAKNPGPPLTILSINIGGVPGTWRVLDHFGKNSQPGVIAVQEASFSPHEWNAFQRKAAQMNYLGCYQCGATSRNVLGHEGRNGGVALLVHKRFPQRLISQSSSENSQMILVGVAGLHVGSLYSPPDHTGDNVAELCNPVSEYLLRSPNHQTQPFLFCGDYNQEPAECDLLPQLSHVGVSEISPGRPTRWNGNREIEFFINNHLAAFSAISCDLVQLSDHIALQVQWLPQVRETFKCTLAKTPDFTIPSSLPVQVWRDILANAWNSNPEVRAFESTLPFIPEVQKEWDLFQNLLNSTFGDSFAKIANDEQYQGSDAALQAQKSARQPGTKGGKAKFRKLQWSMRKPELDTASFPMRRKRKHLARLSELKRLHLLHLQGAGPGDAYQALADKLHLDPRHITLFDLIRDLDQIHREVQQAEAQEKRLRISNWRRNMNTDVKSLRSWLHSKTSPNAYTVVNSNGVHSTSFAEAAKFIFQYWQNFWSSHEAPPTDQIVQTLQQSLPEILPHDINELNLDSVFQIFQRQRGSAGPDGRSGPELSNIPRPAVQLFLKLAARWELAEQVPQQMLESRMVTLPKPNKILQGTIQVQAARPITVMNIWWRIFNSSKIADLNF